MGNEAPYSILVHDLLAIEIFLKLAVASNLKFNAKEIMEQTGAWNFRFSYKLLTGICLIYWSQRLVVLPAKILSSKLAFN